MDGPHTTLRDSYQKKPMFHRSIFMNDNSYTFEDTAGQAKDRKPPSLSNQLSVNIKNTEEEVWGPQYSPRLL